MEMVSKCRVLLSSASSHRRRISVLGMARRHFALYIRHDISGCRDEVSSGGGFIILMKPAIIIVFASHLHLVAVLVRSMKLRY